MRVHAHRSLSVMAYTLVVLFLALSFNAYACLLPVNAVTPPAMANGCAVPDEQPVSQYCDAFKTLGVQAADRLQPNSDSQTICSQDTATLALLVLHTSPGTRLSDHPMVGSLQDLLLKISVLRI